MIKIEEHQLKRLQNISKIIALVALLSLGIFIFLITMGISQVGKINEEINSKQSEVNRVNANLTLANENLMEKEKEIANSNTRVIELQEKINNLNANIANKEIQVKDRETELKKSNDEIKSIFKKNPGVAELKPRIYIQIREESQRNRAKELQKKLQDRGFIVPGIENVGGKIAQKTNLRYCKDTEKKDDLVNIKSFMKIESLIDIEITPPLTKNCDNASSRSYELWLEGDFYIKK